MEDQVDRLTKKCWEKFQVLDPADRFMIAIAGIPGSGKTTLAALITKRLNTLHADAHPSFVTTPPAAFIPMDGYHLSRAQLSALPDPTTAHFRRGAAFTFDGSSFLDLVRKLRKPLCPETQTIYAPSFDHAIKDPVEDDIPIHPYSRILVFEGNYVALDETPWKEAAVLMDEVWFMDVGEDVARERLVSRHVKAGIAKDEEEAGRRIEGNDLVNGRQIVSQRVKVDEMITSRDDEAWKPERQGVRVN
ncbi:MAG: hypothetical protein M1834_009117 [Cirrosporium novae-zelandiae]|nr:MAG: hypothetical protein M1834_009117 [Cirrosporium novae-zelandiae]